MNCHECGTTLKERKCTHCGEVKTSDSYYLVKSGKRAGDLIQPCRPCMREKNRESKKRYYSDPKNVGKKAESDRLYRQNNKELIAANKRRQYRGDKEAARERQRRWERKNPHMAAHYLAERRARTKRAIPPWADMSKIRLMYKKAKEISEKTGVPHEVDHIVPLVAKRNYKHVASGFHCHTNMQIIPRASNRAKAFNFE